MTEKQEEVKLATPIYTRNAKKRYYEKKKQDPEYMAKLAENSKQWKKDHKEEHNEYMREYRARKKEEKKQIENGSNARISEIKNSNKK
jgi:hypothetical protein